MTATVVEPQGRSREARLKEAADKPSTVGTRTDREAGCGRRAGWEQRSPRIIRDAPGRVRRREGTESAPYLGRSPLVRTEEKSAEVVVVRMVCESRPERRTEEPRNGARGRTPGTGEKGSEIAGRVNYGRHPGECGGQKRWNRGELPAAIPRRELGEFPDREPCTRT